jgi:mono/diheme cytochrome c family protein
METQEQKPNDAPKGVDGGGKLRCLFRCGWKFLSTVTTITVLIAVLYAAFRFLPNHAVTYSDIQEHFKYGSTGGEVNLGFPYWIWQAAPLVCADTLAEIAGDRLSHDFLARAATYPSGRGEPAAAERLELSREAYKALGLIFEADNGGRERDLPVGVSKRRNLGLDRVFVNCAVCHTSTVRRDPKGPASLILGMPANLWNLYDFERFFFECAKHPRFSKHDLIAEIQGLGANLGWIDRYLVYPLTIWLMQDRVQFLESRLGFLSRQPEWGPGRVDTFTNARGIFNWSWKEMPDWWKDKKVAPDGVGTADFPSIWLQEPRKKRSDGRQMELHWDGNNDMVEERNLSAAFGTGAIPPIIDHTAIGRIEDWLLNLEPPRFSDFFPVDAELAKKGEPIYQEYCADCHGRSGRDFTGKYVGFVTPIDKIGTDPYRLNNYTYELALNQATLYADEKRSRTEAYVDNTGYPPSTAPDNSGRASARERLQAIAAEENSYRFKHFHKTNGYANMPLDGIWLRAPYLHNGSVPTLRYLLEPRGKRPTLFYRGNDVYDPENVGFQYERSEANGKKFFAFDTAIPGNGNYGHEGPVYGTDLSTEEKHALIEYLKTF